MTAVVAALREELAAVRRRTEVRERRRTEAGAYELGRLGAAQAVLAVAGDGPASARRRLEALLLTADVRRILAIGIAGAASPGLAPAALVAPGRVFRGTSAVPGPDPAWLGQARERAGASGGVLVTVGRLSLAAAERAELARRFEDEPVVVDLETAIWAELAAGRGIPYLAVRAVFDRSETDLPAWIATCIGQDGGVSRPKILLRAAARPGRIKQLLELRRRVGACSERLAAAVERLL